MVGSPPPATHRLLLERAQARASSCGCRGSARRCPRRPRRSGPSASRRPTGGRGSSAPSARRSGSSRGARPARPPGRPRATRPRRRARDQRSSGSTALEHLLAPRRRPADHTRLLLVDARPRARARADDGRRGQVTVADVLGEGAVDQLSSIRPRRGCRARAGCPPPRRRRARRASRARAAPRPARRARSRSSLEQLAHLVVRLVDDAAHLGVHQLLGGLGRPRRRPAAAARRRRAARRPGSRPSSLMPQRPTMPRAIPVTCWMSDSAPVVSSPKTISSATRPPQRHLDLARAARPRCS